MGSQAIPVHSRTGHSYTYNIVGQIGDIAVNTTNTFVTIQYIYYYPVQEPLVFTAPICQVSEAVVLSSALST